MRGRTALVAVTALTCTGLGGTTPAVAKDPGRVETPAKVTVVTTGLNGPRQLSATKGSFYVAESDTGQATRVDRATGARTTIVTRTAQAQGVVKLDGKIYVAAGDAVPAETASTAAPLYQVRPGHAAKKFADPFGYELKYNPDNQTQQGGEDADALYNPYFLLPRKGSGFLLLADAGANDVLGVSRDGKLSTFFVPPSVTTGACARQANNTPAGNSCDSVPTGLAYGPGGDLYISALTGELAGEGRVYVVDKNGKLVKTLSGFSGPTGVAVSDDGSVFVSELLQGLSDGDGARRIDPTSRLVHQGSARAAAFDGLDPTPIGQIVKVAPDGTRTYAQVTMPSGLLWDGGALYASAWAAAGLPLFGQRKDVGQIVRVDLTSFVSR